MPRPPVPVRLLAIAMTCVFSGLGLLAFWTEYAPARGTRFGPVDALVGTPAALFGLSVFCFGLLPLMLLARTRQGALVFGSVVAALGLLGVVAALV